MVHVRLTVTSSPRAARSTVKTQWKKKRWRATRVGSSERWCLRASRTPLSLSLQPSFLFSTRAAACHRRWISRLHPAKTYGARKHACRQLLAWDQRHSRLHISAKNVNQIFFLRQCGCMFFDLQGAASSSSSSSSLSGASRLSAPRQPDSPTKTSLSPLGGGCFCYFQEHASRPPIGNLHRHIFLWDFGSTHVDCCHAAVLERSRTCPSGASVSPSMLTRAMPRVWRAAAVQRLRAPRNVPRLCVP